MGSSKKPQEATRQERKAKKRKLEDAVPDLPGDIADTPDVEIEKLKKKRKRDVDTEDNGIIDEEKARKREKKEKKRLKREAEEATDAVDEVVNGDGEGKKEKKSKKDKKVKESAPEVEVGVEVEAVAEEGPKKSKKERKAERKAKEAAVTEKSEDATPAEEPKAKKGEGKANGEAAEAEGEKKSKKNNRNREKKRKCTTSTDAATVNGEAEKSAGEGKDKKDARFICFIGNLPFSANQASITKHFAAVKPISVRALTQKDDPTKSKGIAFIEFEGYDHMKTCLKMFHHSMFDDGVSAPRKINVELTAGGGGNTKERKGKIQEKNHKLNEQRVRRMQEEEKAKLEKSGNAAAIDESAIHPSRRTRVPGA